MKKVIFFLISAMIGIELFVGIIVAPTIFFPELHGIKVPLTSFQSGLLMTKIFIKLGYLLSTVSLLSLLYSLTYEGRFCKLIMLLLLILAGLFAFYFTPYITHAQSIGETATHSAGFIKMHTYSEWCLKLIIFLQLIALFSLRSKDRDSAL